MRMTKASCGRIGEHDAGRCADTGAKETERIVRIVPKLVWRTTKALADHIIVEAEEAVHQQQLSGGRRP